MPAFGRSALFTAFAVAATATVASAQTAQQNACSIDESSPSQLAIADLDIAAAASATPTVAAPKLKDAIKRLEQVGDKNPNGHALVLGKTLVVWLAQPDIGLHPTRGTLGFTTNTDSTVDMLHSIDSAFVLVENVSPDCAASVAPWRQQKPWVDILKASIDAANNQKLDSAEVLAKESLQLYRGSPYAYMVLGQVAATKGNSKDAIYNFQAAADRATDTSSADTRRDALLELGQVAAAAAQQSGVSPADKDSLLAKARVAFQKLLDDAEAKQQYKVSATKGLATVAVASGDTAAIKNSYAPQLANPSAFSYGELMQAGVAAFSANQIADATKLFESAYPLNPYGRDVLLNLTISYVKDSLFDKALPVAQRLVSVDPANEGDYQLLAFTYGKLSQRYAARGKAAAKGSAAAKALADSARITIDSSLKYRPMADSLPVQVVVSRFGAGQENVNLDGEVTNQTDKPTSYTVKIDFLDKTGAVVQSQTATVGPVPAKGTTQFSVNGTGASIIAFRYTVTANP
jgi:predicted Zn-dependent protease